MVTSSLSPNWNGVMTPRFRTTIRAVALSALAAMPLLAQSAGLTIKEDKPGLLKLAKVAGPDAIKTAQARFPTGTVVAGEIEKEGGKLIYSFDIQLPGVKGIEEVHVDAATGALIATEHENAATEAREKAKPKKPSTL